MSLQDPLNRVLATASAYPDNVAIQNEDRAWTYSQLMQRVRAFAAVFSKRTGPKVAIALPQEDDAYAAHLAAGLARGYFAPLNLSAPIDKLQRIVTRLAPDFIVAAPELGETLHPQAPNATLVDPAGLDIAQQFEGDGTRHQLAYVMFTSGSTGEPKGVMVPRQALAHYVDWLTCFDVTPEDRVAQQPNLGFDISMTDIYAAFCFGASLHPVGTEYDKIMPGQFIERRKITVWNSTPSAISLMMRARQLTPEKFGSVRLVNFCGEALFPEQLDAVFAAAPNATVHNTYGPTEATVAVTCATLTKDSYQQACRASVTLGAPLPGMQITLSDGPTPDEGEAILTGPQLADGYWEDPAKTAEVFITHDGKPAYRTGDWVQRIDGQLFFKERLDFQVKIRGHRIELDEVASAIRKTGWTTAVAFKRKDALAAVVEIQADRTFDEAELKADMARFIEEHAIPGKILAVEHLPRNVNDKLDRKAAAQLFEDTMDARRAARKAQKG